MNVDYNNEGEDIYVDCVTLKSRVGVELPGQLKKVINRNA